MEMLSGQNLGTEQRSREHNPSVAILQTTVPKEKKGGWVRRKVSAVKKGWAGRGMGGKLGILMVGNVCW